MPLYRNIGGIQKSIKAYRNIAGVWKACSVWRNIGGVWKQITSLMTASATSPVIGQKVGVGTSVVTTTASTCTPTGGTGPYTYSWANVGGDVFTITTPTAASTTFSRSTPDGVSYEGYYVCTVTDSLGAVAASNTVTAQISND